MTKTYDLIMHNLTEMEEQYEMLAISIEERNAEMNADEVTLKELNLIERRVCEIANKLNDMPSPTGN